MLFDNEIVEKIIRIKNTDSIIKGDVDATTNNASKIPVIGQYIPTIDVKGDLSHNRSNRVEDTVKVVSSKSTILKPIYKNAKEIKQLDDSRVGNLIKIKGVSLTVINSDEVIAVKALISGFISQVPIEGIGSMNFTSLMEVLFKDSAYVLLGELPTRFGKNEYMMLKIPMSAENEMESQYCISDIEIGKVTVLGVYRGKFNRNNIELKTNNMMAFNKKNKDQNSSSSKDERGMDIEDGIEEVERNKKSSQAKKEMVHYIDVIAIIQDLNI